MVLNSHYSTNLTQAFVLGEAEVRKLVELLSSRIGTVKLSIDCADRVTRNYENVKELFTYENPRDRAILRLRIIAESEDGGPEDGGSGTTNSHLGKQASIEFSNRIWGGIDVACEARESVVSHLRADILDVLSGTRPWYSALHRIDFMSVLMVAALIILMLVFAAIALAVVALQEPNVTQARWAGVLMLGLPLMILAVATGLLTNRVRDRCFPRAVFLIGQGKTRFIQLERVQWAIVIGLAVSIIGSLIVAGLPLWATRSS